MSKVVIIGIDGLDSLLLEEFQNDLPNLTKLRLSGQRINFTSVFPPDSPTAWTSIYTGQNPAEHGIVSFKDPFSSVKTCEHLGTSISGKTFWDEAGRRGFKVCIINPHMGYPVWSVNGVMIGRTTEVDIRKFDIQTFPPDLIQRYDLSTLKSMTSYPLTVGKIIDPTKQLILNEMNIGLKLFKEIEWDLYFIYFSSLDNIEHLFWMYHDINDPSYHKNNEYENVIHDFYRFFDENVIGPFVKELQSDTALIVISDHGHGLRPNNVIQVNQLLKENNLLYSKLEQGRNLTNSFYSTNKLKKIIISSINEYRLLGKIASLLLRLFPASANIVVKATDLDYHKTKAYLSDPSGGLKSYSYAGIKINRTLIDIEEYELYRERIINILQSMKISLSSNNVVEWVRKREEVYTGENISKLPDILFKLTNEWGVGWEINKGIVGKSYSHKLHSGNHRQDTPVLLIENIHNINVKDQMTLMDVAPLVLALLENNKKRKKQQNHKSQ